MFQAMKEKVEKALQRGDICNDITQGEEEEILKRWKGFTRNDHPSVIQVSS